MKKVLVVFLYGFLLSSCDLLQSLKGELNEQKSSLDEDLIVSFYKEVLDTLVDENYLRDRPLFLGKYGVLAYKEIFGADSAYVNWQLAQFREFKWSGHQVLSSQVLQAGVLSPTKSIQKDAWKQLGEKAILEISTPFFSPDLRWVFISVHTSTPVCGWENDYVFHQQQGKWVLKYLDGKKIE